MNQIICLDETTANKIAAGEVVERPASVVKEMVENALDAGATSIDVEIREGGKDYLRIVDNGQGIPEAEVPIAFERHATSKIRRAEDLFQVLSLGFRGEALPGIAAVSELEMITKTFDAPVGTLIAFSGGKKMRLEKVGAPVGTTVTVRRLFFNTPARLKFLNQAASERRYVFDILGRLALAHPMVQFRLVSDGEEIFVTPGDGNMEAVMWSIYGSRIGSNLLPVEREANYITIRGLVCKPDVHRGNRQAETFIVNGRVVESSLMASAVEKGYQSLLPRRRFPIAVISLTMEPSHLDVNVHPAKREIRFSDSSEVYKQVMLAVRNTLESRLSFKAWSLDSSQKATPMATKEAVKQPRLRFPYESKSGKIDSYQKIRPTLPFASRPKTGLANDEVATARIGYTPEQQGTCGEVMMVSEASLSMDTNTDRIGDMQYRVLGQFQRTYVLAEAEEELWLIDQHVAHERILYERLQKQLQAKRIEAQALLVPLHLELGITSTSAVLEWGPKLAELGFEVTEFGPKDCLVRTVPTDLSGISEKELGELLLEIIAKGQTNDYRETTLIIMSCKGAVKAGEWLSLPVMEQLVTDLMATKNPFTCPHGRPVVVRLNLRDIHRRFGRI